MTIPADTDLATRQDLDLHRVEFQWRVLPMIGAIVSSVAGIGLTARRAGRPD